MSVKVVWQYQHRFKHSGVLLSALERYAHGLECAQHSVHSNPAHLHALS